MAGGWLRSHARLVLGGRLRVLRVLSGGRSLLESGRRRRASRGSQIVVVASGATARLGDVATLSASHVCGLTPDAVGSQMTRRSAGASAVNCRTALA
jgi:hypothetical protein